MEELYPEMEPFSTPVTYADANAARPDVFIFRQIFTPFRLARALIQLGYEPLVPSQCFNPMSFIGLGKSPIYCYPNVFVYTRYLFHTRGFWRTLSCGFASRFIFDILTETSHCMCHWYIVEQRLRSGGSVADELITGTSDSMILECSMEEASFQDFTVQLLEVGFLKLHEVLLTQPFFVIMVRQMASFVGEETGYYWFHQAVYSIYKENGFGGFFSGFTSRLMFELMRLGLYVLGCRVLRHHLLNNCPRSAGFLAPLRSFLFVAVNTLSHRLEVVSTMMAIRGSRLAAAKEVNRCANWRACSRLLGSNTGQAYRGYLPFWRCHVQPSHMPTVPVVVNVVA